MQTFSISLLPRKDQTEITVTLLAEDAGQASVKAQHAFKNMLFGGSPRKRALVDYFDIVVKEVK